MSSISVTHSIPLNPLPCVEVDWYWINESALIGRNIRHWDLKDSDVRYDNVRLGYWVKTPSPTATVLALKGCKFKQKMGQTNW
jgi:hypothetical protein